MLLWQLKSAHNRHKLWLKLFTCSFITHLFFIGILFCKYHNSTTSHKFTVHSNMPNTHFAVVLAPTAQNTVIPNQIKQTTVTRTTRSQAQKQVPKKIESKRTATHITPEKSTTAKIKAQAIEKPKPICAQANTATEQKKQPKKNPEIIEKKVTPIKKTTEPQKIVEKTLPHEINKGNAQQLALPQTEKQYVEVSYAQAQELFRQEALKKELSRHWKPPHGIAQTCSCEITAHVGTNGVITDIEINQPSGILMYDVSARAAILAMNLPRWTWGESFTVTLKP